MEHITLPPGCGIIYMYTFDNGKRYIGQTVDPVTRFHNHHSTAGGKPRIPVDYALRTHDYIYSVLEVLPIDELDAEEIRLIKAFNTLAPNGYNISTGGTNGNRGGGSTLAKKIVVFNAKTGDFLGNFPSMRDVADAFGTTKQAVSKCCRTKGTNRNHTLIFRFAEEYPDCVLPNEEIYTGMPQEWVDKIVQTRRKNFTEETRRRLSESHKGFKRSPESIRKTVDTKIQLGIHFGPHQRPIDIYDAKTGDIVGHYTSAEEAGKFCGVTKKQIYNNLNGWNKTVCHNKYYCKWGDE